MRARLPANEQRRRDEDRAHLRAVLSSLPAHPTRTDLAAVVALLASFPWAPSVVFGYRLALVQDLERDLLTPLWRLADGRDG